MWYILTSKNAYKWNYKRLGKNLLTISLIAIWYIAVIYMMNQDFFSKTGKYLINIK